jgi:phytoene desaturase
MAKSVTVVGGGLGSLTGAIRLAKLGFQVSLFEKNANLGGKINEYRQDGYRFDMGPSLLTMPFVLDEFFQSIGYRTNQFLDIIPLEPITRYFFSDQKKLDIFTDRDKMARELGLVFPDQKDAYFQFLQYAKSIYDTAAAVFLHRPIHELRKLVNKDILLPLLQIYKIDPFRSVHQANSEFFSNEDLLQLFDRYATYNGSNPYRAPATLNIIPFVENVLGGYYLKGGMYQLIKVLEKIAHELGVQIYKSIEVEKIVHAKGKVYGIQINKEIIYSDYVLCGADVIETHNHLIDGYNTVRQKLNRLEPSLSGMVFLWSVNKKHPQLIHHNIFFSEDYQKEFKQIFDDLQPPDDPTIYVSITSKSDPQHAPANGENWFVLLNMPYLTEHQDWSAATEKMRLAVFNTIKRNGIDIKSAIEMEKVITPTDFYQLYGSNRGSIYGISSNSRLTAFKRPANRSRILKNLYFAGGSTHPGGGIPLVILSGKMAAELIAEAEDLSVPKRISSIKSNKNLPDYKYSTILK